MSPKARHEFPRAVALGVLERQRGASSQLLVQPGRDPETGAPFHRLIGGGVDFGERGAETVAREFFEEYGLAVATTRRLAVIENIFHYDGRAAHELLLVFEVVPSEPDAIASDRIAAQESGMPDAVWRDPGSEVPLLPVELLSVWPKSESGA